MLASFVYFFSTEYLFYFDHTPELIFVYVCGIPLLAIILVVRSFKEMGREGEKAALGMRWKYSIASNGHDSWSEKYDRTLENAKKRLAGLKSQ